MKQFFYEIDVNKFSFIDIVKLLLMPKNKYNALVKGYREAFRQFRSVKVQKSILNKFIEQ